MDRKHAGAIWLDASVGAVLRKLGELGLQEKTAVFLASDNGRDGKFACYDGGARSLLLARWNGFIPRGRVIRELVTNIDLAPTILDLCGVKAPNDLQMDGQSLVPLLQGDAAYRRGVLFLEITTERAVVTEDGFKYIAVRYPPEIQQQVDQGRRFNHWCQPMEKNTHTMGVDAAYPHYFDQDQLYDLNADPDEQRNLAGDPEYHPRLESMKKLLREHSIHLPHQFGEFTKR
jgi:arylsulfatase A-like enzyme